MLISRFVRALLVNSVVPAGSFTAKPETLTRPANDGVIEINRDPNGPAPYAVRIMPIGLGNDLDAFGMKVISWNAGLSRTQQAISWIHEPLLEATATLSAYVGTAGCLVPETERFADIIAPVALMEPLQTMSDSGGVGKQGKTWFFSPANDQPAWVDVPIMGAELIELLFKRTAGAPGMNALIRFLYCDR